MFIQQHHTHSATNAMDHSSVTELELFRNILNSVNTGVGLMDKNYTLLYCNSSFNTLLENRNKAPLGEKIYLNKGLKRELLWKIHQQLDKSDYWQGVIPGLGKGLKVKISRISFPIPASILSLSNAYFMLVASDYSDILRQEKELVEAKCLAEKSDNSKSEFLSQMSHELRTPLNAVIGFTQLLQIGDTLTEEQEGYLGEIISASNYLLKLINETLNLSRIEHEHAELTLHNESFHVGNLITECISLVKPLAQKKSIQILQRESNTYLVKDRVRLKQVLLNLLSNAIKYNHSGGRVVIQSFFANNNNIHIEVQDSGKGIQARLLNTIFNPFERLGVKDSQIEGSGIGLMITRRLVNLMNGKVSVLSEPGGGSIFSLDFPSDPANCNEEASCLSEEIRKIIWIGNDPISRKFAERLTGLRPALEFHHTKDITAAIRLSVTLAPDLILLLVEHSLALLNKPSAEIEDLLKRIPTVAVIGNRPLSECQIDMKLGFCSNLSMPLNAIDFMEVIDLQLCR